MAEQDVTSDIVSGATGPWSMLGPAGMVYGGFKGFASGRSAAKKARKIRKENLRLHDMQTAENLKQFSKQAGQVLGEGRGKIYASNLMMSGTPQSYMQELESELGREMNWMKVQADAQARVIRKGGSAAASSAKSQGFQSLLGGLSSGAQMIWGK